MVFSDETDVRRQILDTFESGVVETLGDNLGYAGDPLVGVDLGDDEIAEIRIYQTGVDGGDFHVMMRAVDFTRSTIASTVVTGSITG